MFVCVDAPIRGETSSTVFRSFSTGVGGVEFCVMSDCFSFEARATVAGDAGNAGFVAGFAGDAAWGFRDAGW